MVMATLSKREIEKILAQQKPGYVVATAESESDADSATSVQADDRAPSLGQLKSKYASSDSTFVDLSAAASEPDVAATTDSGDATPDDTLVAIKPEGTPDAYHRGPGPKAVLISGRDKRIIAEQG
jgi:hypothetical protein